MPAAAPAVHRGTNPEPSSGLKARAPRHPLPIAFAIALLLHLAVALALPELDWPPRAAARGTQTEAAPLRFELLPTPESEKMPSTVSPDGASAAFPTGRPKASADARPEAVREDPAREPTPTATSVSSTSANAQPFSTPLPQPGVEPETASKVPAEPDPVPPPGAIPAEPFPNPAEVSSSPSAPAAGPSKDPLAGLESLEPSPTRAISAADILASRDQALAGLGQQQWRPPPGAAKRRKAISASTQEYIYANYLESWRRKVERIGNLNYPEEAKEKRLFGSLVLQAAVRADGSLESVRVLRSSGQDVLDQAAVRIVELAAPFAPFPPDIRAQHDVLDITRTWQFMRNQKLGWDQ